ncbi:hypothetical protein CG723_39115 [Streptomyces sp. CB01635]|nr:hypothetical protein CG723_39115 [Streptomyces sp. CB01635]
MEHVPRGVVPLVSPAPERRRLHPGRLRVPDRAAPADVMYVLRTGLAWRDVPAERVGCSGSDGLAPAAGLDRSRRPALPPTVSTCGSVSKRPARRAACPSRTGSTTARSGRRSGSRRTPYQSAWSGGAAKGITNSQCWFTPECLLHR